MELYYLPKTYMILDLETTGLSPEKDQIIEIGALCIENGIPVRHWHSLLCPELSLLPNGQLSPHVSALTGISTDMLLPAPAFSTIAAELLSFLGQLPIGGHRVAFDLAFLNAALSRIGQPSLPNDYFDTLLLSQRLLPELIHHRLQDLAAYYQIDYSGAHRALRDCEITWLCLEEMKKTALASFPTAEAFQKQWKSGSRQLRAEDILPHSTSFNKEHPFYGKNIAITGVLSTLSRRAAMQKIADLGGRNQDKVTIFTHFLICGQHSGTKKEKKALRLREKGYPIQLLSEEEFLSL